MILFRRPGYSRLTLTSLIIKSVILIIFEINQNNRSNQILSLGSFANADYVLLAASFRSKKGKLECLGCHEKLDS